MASAPDRDCHLSSPVEVDEATMSMRDSRMFFGGVMVVLVLILEASNLSMGIRRLE